MMKKLSSNSRIRLLVQIAFLVLSTAILSFVIMQGSKAIHNSCPYAIVCFGMNPAQLMGLLPPLFLIITLLSLLIGISTMFFGRIFCGYICPLGTIQEAVFQLRSRKYKIKKRIPWFIERRFAFMKYLSFFVTTGLVIAGLAHTYINFCPFYALSQLPALNLKGLALLLIIVISAFFAERFWCRYLCPYAAFLNIFQTIGKLFGIRRKKVRRNLERCNDCGLCNLYCPMNISLLESEYVQDQNCIHCNQCAECCPKDAYLPECQEDI